MTREELLSLIKNNSHDVEFDDVIETINSAFIYTPTSFSNGAGDDMIVNKAGINEGSCKIFAFAHLSGLNKEQTLSCFGQYYRNDVLSDPLGDNHANIRHFIRHGWNGIHFDGVALDPV